MGPDSKPDAIRALKQVRQKAIAYLYSHRERSLYAIAEVTRDPYPIRRFRKAKIWCGPARV